MSASDPLDRTDDVHEATTRIVRGRAEVDRGVGHDTAELTGVPALEPLVLEAVEPELDIALEPRFEVSSAPAGSDPYVHVLLTLKPEGPSLVDPSQGPVAHVILALDISASMNHADKYPVLTAALDALLTDLHRSSERDVLLSVVVFAKGFKTLFNSVPASKLTSREVLRAIDESPLRFGRYTDVAGALSRAGRIAYDCHKSQPALPLRIVLMTDGRPQDVDGALTRMEKVAKHIPVDVDALAFGSDADVGVLRQLVLGRRGGTVKHVRRDTLEDAFGHLGEVAQRVVAKRSLLRLDLAAGVVGAAAYRFRPARHAFGETAYGAGRVFECDLGTLEAGRTYSLLFRVRLPQTQATTTHVGDVVLKIPGWGGPQEYRCSLDLARHTGAEVAQEDPTVVEARDVLAALDGDDPFALLASLQARRKMYIAERRDPYLLQVVDKAIAQLEAEGTLDSLSLDEHAVLTSHTATAGSLRERHNRREYSFG